MPMIVLLKILSDLGFYYTFVGTAAAALGSSSIAILIAMGVESICFTAAFALGLARGWEVREAIAFGQKASAIAVTRKGAQSSVPDAYEIS